MEHSCGLYLDANEQNVLSWSMLWKIVAVYIWMQMNKMF